MLEKPSPRSQPMLPKLFEGCRATRGQAVADVEALGQAEFLEPSEPRQVGKGSCAAMDMHAAEFGAAMQHREHLAGVEQVPAWDRRRI
jgi:hypothetical protein